MPFTTADMKPNEFDHVATFVTRVEQPVFVSQEAEQTLPNLRTNSRSLMQTELVGHITRKCRKAFHKGLPTTYPLTEIKYALVTRE